MSRILVVEDEAHLAEGLAFNLRNSGYDVSIATNGEEALETIGRLSCDLILLDVMLPGIDGLEVARRLRKAGQTVPILIVSAQDRAAEAIAGLDAGADDFITKPFDLDEMLARIRGALRRQVWGRAQGNNHNHDQGAAPAGLRYGRWQIDFQSFSATSDRGESLEITPKELAILKLFAARPGEVISREKFLEEVWEMPGTIESRTVDNFIRRLRQSFEDDPANPRHIVSIRGAGYRFVP